MKIAAIDPGVTTGYAIAWVHEQPKTVSLECVVLRDTPNPLEVIRSITRSRCMSVVLERRPANASREGTEHYELLLNQLIMNGYRDPHHFRFSDNSLALVSPGLWKPVIKAQQIMDYGSWDIQSDHMRDALGLLHYVIKLNFMNKEIEYE